MTWQEISDKWNILGIVLHLNKFIGYLFKGHVKQASGAKTAGNFVSWFKTANGEMEIGDSGSKAADFETTGTASAAVSTHEAASNPHMQYAYKDGWQPANESWAYASATTITVPAGAASRYQKGDKIKLTQTTIKYFYVIAVADTLLTVTGGSDYSLANAAITSPFYSKIENPQGWPGMFAVSAPTWTTTGTAFTNTPTNGTYFMRVQNNTCFVTGFATCNATSGGTGAFNADFPAGQLPVLVSSVPGRARNGSNFRAGVCYQRLTNQVRMNLYDGSALAGNGEAFSFMSEYVF